MQPDHIADMDFHALADRLIVQESAIDAARIPQEQLAVFLLEFGMEHAEIGRAHV